MKPSLFVGSSIESLETAYGIQENLEHDAEVTVWTQGIFDLSKYALDSLVDNLEKADFGVFVFAPDDVIKIRGKEFLTARDNVIFELGLFIGHLGKERCFILIPRGFEDFHLPTDLLGMTPGTYEAKRIDGNLVASLGPASNKIRKVLHRIGTRSKELEMICSSESSTEEEIIDKNDALKILEKWLGQQDAIEVGEKELYHFSHVASETNLPKKLVEQVFEQAAKRWNLEVVSSDDITILLRALK